MVVMARLDRYEESEFESDHHLHAVLDAICKVTELSMDATGIMKLTLPTILSTYPVCFPICSVVLA